MNDPHQQARQLVAELRKHSDAERIAATQNYYPSAQENLGVYAANIRKVVRQFAREIKGEPSSAAFDLAHAIIELNTLEGRQCAYEIVAAHRSAMADLDRKKLERLMVGLDNWVSVDTFACSLSGAAWREGQLADRDVIRWSASKDPWIRRAALVSTIPLNMKSRGGSGDVPRTIAACERAVGDEHIMVHKALSWALRTLISVDAAAVGAFLETHDAALPALVKREVRRKLETGKKSGNGK